MKEIKEIAFTEEVKFPVDFKTIVWKIYYNVYDAGVKVAEHTLYFNDKNEAMREFFNLETAMDTQKPDIVKTEVDKYIFYGSNVTTNDLVNRAPFLRRKGDSNE